MKEPAAHNDLFRIGSLSHQEGTITVSVHINKNSEIFQGHFPGKPVVPGACMLQLVKDVLEKALKSRFRLSKADHLKFMQLIEPSTAEALQLDISYGLVDENTINVTAKLINGETPAFKFQGTFIKE